jgi:hypothetical protein
VGSLDRMMSRASIVISIIACVCCGPIDSSSTLHDAEFVQTPESLSVDVHMLPSFESSWSMRDMLVETNALLNGAVELGPITVFPDRNMPGSFDDTSHALTYASGLDKRADVIVLATLRVAVDHTGDGLVEVAGATMGTCCEPVVVLSAAELRSDTLAHELGHVLGLEHTTDHGNIMGTDRVWNTGFDVIQRRMMTTQLMIRHDACRGSD